MKISFVSFSDSKGGASFAAYSIFQSVKKKKIRFFCIDKKKKDTNEIYGSFFKIYILTLRVIEKVLIYIFIKGKYHQSLNIFFTSLGRVLKKKNLTL